MIKTLHLTLLWKWFDLIAQGKKNVEYRDRTQYWISRLRGRNFDEVSFRNGYGRHRPVLRCKCLGIIENTEKNRFEILLDSSIPTP